MQLRELLKSQQILAPLVSAKNTSQQNEWDAFSQLLANKNEKMTEKPISSNDPFALAGKRNDETPKFVKETNPDKKFNVKVDVSGSAGYKPNESQTIDTENKPVEKTETAPKETKAAHKTDDDDTTSVESDKLKAALKAKLKKETGLSEGQLDQLIASMNLSTDALKQMLAGGSASSELFAELSETIENLEIDEALDKNLTGNDLTHLKNQLDKLVETLDKVMENVPKSDDESVETSDNAAKALPFEMKIVQALSKIIADLNAVDSEATSETSIRPEEVRKAIMQAIQMTQTPTTQDDTSVEDAAKVSAPNVLTLSAVSSTQSSTLNSNMSEETPANQNPTPLPNVVQVPTQVVQSVSGQSPETANQETEAEVKTVEGLSMHQVAMKQGNSITTTTVQQTPQLKQEIFTQIMDAIKGQIKLSDHGTSLLVKLQPEQLGNVELKLNIHKGIVLAEIKVENEIVKAAIESNLDDLKQSLSNKGYSVDQINVNVDSGKKDRQEAFEFNQQEKRNRQNQQSDEASNLEPLETLTKYIVDEYEGSTINYYG